MNSITHFELPVNAESKKFYLDTFGWEVQEMPEMDYTIVRTSEIDEQYMPKNPAAVNGGMMSVENNGGTNPVLVIDVPDLDEVLEKVKAAKLEIVQPKTSVGGMGWYFRFKDQAGVITGVWETTKQE